MKERVDPLKGLVHPAPSEATVARYLPSERYACFVEHCWIARWHVQSGTSTLSELTYPSVQIVVECSQSISSAYVVGVMTDRFTKDLAGSGHVLGIKLRAGGFYPLVRKPVAAFTNKRLPLRDVFGAPAGALEQAVRESTDDESAIRAAEVFLGVVLPAADLRVARVNQIVDSIAAHRTISSVDQLAIRFGLSTRALQRLFHKFVGVPPKWVIRRYRLLDAIDELGLDDERKVGRLAADLGYFDQSHFAREFKTHVGVSPARYTKHAGNP